MALVLLKRIFLLLLSAGGCISVFGVYQLSEYKTEQYMLPYAVTGTTLLLESFEGSAVEPVKAVFYNNSDTFLESFYVEIRTIKERYIFETTMLPPNERVLLFEKDQKLWDTTEIIDITGYCKAFDKLQDHVLAGSVTVRDRYLYIKNTDDEVINSIELYLKLWDEEHKCFTNKAEKIIIKNFQPGDQLQINLKEAGFKVVFVCINKPQHNDPVLRLFDL